MRNQLRSTVYISLALALGILTGFLHQPILFQAATFVSELFLGALRLIGIPIIFMSILSTISGFDSIKEMSILGRKVLKYTLLTTIIAASTALVFYLSIKPSTGFALSQDTVVPNQPSFLGTLINMFPTNFVEVFLENNVFGAALISAVLGFSVLSLPEKQRVHLHNVIFEFISGSFEDHFGDYSLYSIWYLGIYNSIFTKARLRCTSRTPSSLLLCMCHWG